MLNRRHIIGGATALPAIVMASCGATPAIAGLLNGDRHGAWLAERNRMMARANTLPSDSKALDQACDALNSIEGRIIHTPAANRAEAKAKLRFTAILDAEGTMLTAEDAAELLTDIASFLAGER